MKAGRDYRNFFCVAVFRHASTKRSLNITANCVFASNHSRGGDQETFAKNLQAKKALDIAA
jgi:hypothetical protein